MLSSQGTAGEKGIKGEKGEKGDTGLRGEAGSPGLKGEAGAKVMKHSLKFYQVLGILACVAGVRRGRENPAGEREFVTLLVLSPVLLFSSPSNTC